MATVRRPLPGCLLEQHGTVLLVLCTDAWCHVDAIVARAAPGDLKPATELTTGCASTSMLRNVAVSSWRAVWLAQPRRPDGRLSTADRGALL